MFPPHTIERVNRSHIARDKTAADIELKVVTNENDIRSVLKDEFVTAVLKRAEAGELEKERTTDLKELKRIRMEEMRIGKWDWVKIRKMRMEQCLSLDELTKRFGIPAQTLKHRSFVEKWPPVDLLKERKGLLREIAHEAGLDPFWGEWLGWCRANLRMMMQRLLATGTLDPMRMTEEDIEKHKRVIDLMHRYENLVTTHTMRAAKVRAMEREDYEEQDDNRSVDMAGLLVFAKKAIKESDLSDYAVVDVTTDTIQRDIEVGKEPSA